MLFYSGTRYRFQIQIDCLSQTTLKNYHLLSQNLLPCSNLSHTLFSRI